MIIKLLMLVMSFSSSAGICIFLVHCQDSEVKWKLDIIGNVLVLACINKETYGHMGVGTLSSQKQFSNKLLDMLILGCLL